jgi:hypothetical protein
MFSQIYNYGERRWFVKIETPSQKNGVFYFTSNDFCFIFVPLIKKQKIMKLKTFLFALMSILTLNVFSQVDTIIVTPNSATYALLQYPDSLGFNAKVSVRQPPPNTPAYECGFPNVTLESSMAPIAIAIVYSDDAATQWLSTQFLFNLPYNGDSLEFCLNYVGECNCFIDPMYDTDGDGIICDTIWNSTPDTIPNDIVAAWIYKLECVDNVSELTNNIKVWPNPIGEMINISAPSNNTNVKIMSVDGKCVYNQKFYQNQIQINGNILSKGSYVILMTDDSGEVYTTRIIK